MKGKRPAKKGTKAKAAAGSRRISTLAAGPECYPGSVLARLAEAVDGVRDGKPHWWLVESAFPHKNPRYFDSLEEAKGARTDGVDIEPLGPFCTQPKGRVKKQVTSVTVAFEDGTQRTVKGKDALLWSEAAVEKFAIPYYTYAMGVAEADALWVRYLESESPLLCHEPLSDPELCEEEEAAAYKASRSRKAKKS